MLSQKKYLRPGEQERNTCEAKDNTETDVINDNTQQLLAIAHHRHQTLDRDHKIHELQNPGEQIVLTPRSRHSPFAVDLHGHWWYHFQQYLPSQAHCQDCLLVPAAAQSYAHCPALC